jgi:diguanylate cyclase (GGDEF)-like protein
MHGFRNVPIKAEQHLTCSHHCGWMLVLLPFQPEGSFAAFSADRGEIWSYLPSKPILPSESYPVRRSVLLQRMATAVNVESPRTRQRDFAGPSQTWIVAIGFAGLITAQALAFIVLGTGRWGAGLSELIIVVESLLGIHCARIAFRRAQGTAALFWFLFGVVQVVLLVPTTIQTYDTLFGQSIVSDLNRSLLYCLYGAPSLMMLFLPETHRRERVKSEIFLDLFQVGIVVSLIYATFFFLPVQRMLPDEAMRQGITISDVQSVLLLIAVLVRLQFARSPDSRSRLLRLGFFLLICAVATFMGAWIYVHYSAAVATWFDLGWAVPQAVAGMIAVSWFPAAESAANLETEPFSSFLATNLVLVTMLCSLSLLMDRWKQAYGAALADLAIAASLLAFSLRLALTQYHQHQEIAQRKAAQIQLTASHQKIGRLLDDAQRQTSEITQISELGSVLHASASREEVYRLIPERLRRLFPNASGSVSILSPSRNRVESLAQWGVLCPAGEIFSVDQCWALRRGCMHTQEGGPTAVRCFHLRGEGPSVCIPLIANGDAIGLLIIQNNDVQDNDVQNNDLQNVDLQNVDSQNDDFATQTTESDTGSGTFTRRRQLAATVSEHIALAIANVNLREALRAQAVRDPLTGLYNRRYMQEFLDRELHSARRKCRPLAVMMLDLDHFKRYNDNFGHAAGDNALATVGELLLHSVRAEDIACRYGGEEFTLILPECSLRQAMVRAEGIRRRVQELRSQIEARPTDPLTISIGVAAFEETTDRVDLLLKFADDALYLAKRAGGNHVTAASPAVALPESDTIEADEAASASVEIH